MNDYSKYLYIHGSTAKSFEDLEFSGHFSEDTRKKSKMAEGMESEQQDLDVKMYPNQSQNVRQTKKVKQSKNARKSKNVEQTKNAGKYASASVTKKAGEKVKVPLTTPIKKAPKKAKQKVVTRQVEHKKGQKSQERVNIASFVIFLIGMVAVLMVFFKYIDIHTKTLDASRVLTKREQLLQKMKSENDAKEDSLNSNVDLQYVYDIATTQYGMVHASDNQIIVYKKNESEYVKQNEEIPTQ